MDNATAPNLFRFATSELSQDAFICWLLSWAKFHYRASNRPLHDTGRFLLRRLLEVGNIQPPTSYDKIEINQQYKGIDVLVLVNDDMAIIIEDKTYTESHSSQLERYLDTVRTDYPQRRIAAIYLKTGDQSNYKAVEGAGFATLRRKAFLEVLQYGREQGVDNHIFRDFHHHLLAIEEAVDSYRDLAVVKWQWSSWTGFFIELQKQMGDGEWGYVPNPSGGFMGFWWHWRENKYLQLEMERLCFKIEVEDKAHRAARWQEWHEALMEESKNSLLSLKRPSRRRSGTWMTVALLDGGYRQTDERGMLDIDQTVALLRKAEGLLDSAVGKQS